MKVVAKFALLFFLSSCLVLFAFGYGSAQREAKILEQSAIVDLTSLGTGLSDGVALAWRLSGKENALRILNAADQRRSDVQVRWFTDASQIPNNTPGPHVIREPNGVRILLPISIDDQLQGAIELTKPLPSQRAIFVSELGDEVLYSVFLAIISALLAVLVGGAVIGRPLQRIVEQARRIGSGDFSQRLRNDRGDEIGVLKRELNTMCEQLESAKKRIDDETLARATTLEQLRHLDRLRTVGTMASSLAHELGTPMNVLLIRGQSLCSSECPPDEVKEAGQVIVNQVEKMGRVVRQMLDFSRKKKPQKGDVDAVELVQRSTSLLSTIAKKMNVVLQTEIIQSAIIIGDINQLEQALTNIIVNGIHAMPNGGSLTIRLSTQDTPAHSHLPHEDHLCVIDVIDHGVGIAEQDLQMLFEPFYTTKPTGVGTGLGLSVARGIVEEHNGWIAAQSALGKGSIFSLYLPRKP